MGINFSKNNEFLIDHHCEIEEYFSLIHQYVKKYSFENELTKNSIDSKHNNKSNKFPNKKKKKIPTIHWKDFILNHLLSQYSKERQWVPELYHLIKAETFYTEKHWLSFFFWDEFEMRTKPSCLIKKVKSKFYPQSEFFTYNVEQNNSQKDITSDFKVFQEKTYAYIRILGRHISTNGHPFKFIIVNFAIIFTKYIKSHIIALSSLNKTSNDEFTKKSVSICEDIIEQLVSFINVLEEALLIMYSKTYNSEIFIEEKDEFINLISGCLFSENSLYKCIMTLIRMSLSLEIKELDQILDLQKYVTPDILGIPHKLCLNQLSLQYYKEKLNGKKENSIEEFAQPYQRTIDILKSIVKYKKPYDKLLLIYKMSHTIADCINAFWNKVDLTFPTKSFSVDSDDLMNIFDYIVVKTQMGDLLTHMKFVKSFTSTATRSTMIGYYFSTLEISVNYMNSLKDKYFNSISNSLKVDCQSLINAKKGKSNST